MVQHHFYLWGFDADNKRCGVTIFLVEENLKELVFTLQAQGGRQIPMHRVMTEEFERFLGSGEFWDWGHENDGTRLISSNGTATYSFGKDEIIPPWQRSEA